MGSTFHGTPRLVGEEFESSESSTSTFCGVLLTGLKCWGRAINQTNPTDVSWIGQHICALGNEGILCLGERTLSNKNIPSLSNPYQVAEGYQHTCVLEDSGVVCWGDASPSNVPQLRNPTMVTAGGSFSCALMIRVLCAGATIKVLFRIFPTD